MAAANPILSGMMRAIQVRSMLEDAQRQNERFALLRRQQDRADEIRDLETTLRLNTIGRPVTGGLVEELNELPDAPGAPPTGAAMRITRKADPSRTVKYKTRGGQVIERELPTPEEQFDLTMKRLRQEQDVKSQAQLAGLKQRLEAESVPVGATQAAELGLDPGTKIPRAAMGSLLSGVASVRSAKERAKKPAATPRPFFATDDAGQGRLIYPGAEGAKVEPVGKVGKSKTPKEPKPLEPVKDRHKREEDLAEIRGDLLSVEGFLRSGKDPVSGEKLWDKEGAPSEKAKQLLRKRQALLTKRRLLSGQREEIELLEEERRAGASVSRGAPKTFADYKKAKGL